MDYFYLTNLRFNIILNGKVPNRQRHNKIKQCGQENHDFDDDFTTIELQNSLKHLKNGKVAGLDEILNEEIKNIGPVTMPWVLSLLNACARSHRLPILWRQARVVALLKPGKDPSNPKSFRPISLLCHLYKLYERLILKRLSPIIAHVHIGPTRAGWLPPRQFLHCQVVNITQHIEDGLDTGELTGIFLLDISAAYDTVNHRRLIEKVYSMTREYRLMYMIRTVLDKYRFFVELERKRSRWRLQKNGLPLLSVLAPLLFNVYTNDQHLHPGTRSIVYADDLAVTTQSTNFAPIEETLTSALVDQYDYNTTDQLHANPTKTKISLLHLRNRECGKPLNISWNGVTLTDCNLPVYTCVTLDITLSYKAHIEKTKKKVGTRNNIIRKQPTNTNSQPILAGIALSDIRKAVAIRTERTRQATDERHPLTGQPGVVSRLKSRNSFTKCMSP